MALMDDYTIKAMGKELEGKAQFSAGEYPYTDKSAEAMLGISRGAYLQSLRRVVSIQAPGNPTASVEFLERESNRLMGIVGCLENDNRQPPDCPKGE